MVHLADTYDQATGVQRCRLCGYVIVDYHGAMVPEDDTRPLSGFQAGAHVEIEGENPRYSGVTDAAPDCLRVD